MSDEGVKTGLWSTIGSKAARRDEYSTAERIGGWQAYKTIWSGHFTKVLFVSLLTLIFVAPAIAWMIVLGVIGGNVGTSVPFNIFDGIGYPSPDFVGGEYGMAVAEGLSNRMYFDAAMLEYSVLIACIAIAGVGIGAMTYVARLYMYGEQVKVLPAFFRGVAVNWATGLTGGLLSGASLFLVILTQYSFTLHGWSMVGRVFALIGAILLFVFVVIYSFYLVNLSSAYKMSYPRILRDAALLTFANLPRNLLSALLAGLFVGAMFLLNLLFGGSQMSMLPWVVMFFLGFFGIAAIFVALSQIAFSRYINEGLVERETKLKNEQYYAAKREQRKAQKAAGVPAEGGKKQPARYVNPKKKKSGKQAAEHADDKAQPAPEQEKPRGYSESELAKMEEDRRKVAELATEERKEASGLEDLSVYEDDED